MNRICVLLAAFTIVLTSCGKKSEETSPVRKDVTELVFASGVLEAENTYNLTAEVDGYLAQMIFNEGDEINSGTALAVVDNLENLVNSESSQALYRIAEENTKLSAPALQQAASAVQLSRQKSELDSIQFMRYKTLYEKNTVSKTEYESYLLQFTTSKSNYFSALENYRLLKQQADQQLISSKATKSNSGAQSSRNYIKAVVSGRVYKKLKQPGDFVRKGDAIATIGSATVMYAKVNIDESNISKIQVGQEAIVQLNTIKSKSYKGVVSKIYPSFDDASQSFICKISFVDSLDFKISGTQLQSNIVISKQKSALLIPRNFLNYDGTVQLKKQKKKVYVQTEFIGKDWVQIASGLDERVVLVTENLIKNKVNQAEPPVQMR